MVKNITNSQAINHIPFSIIKSELLIRLPYHFYFKWLLDLLITKAHLYWHAEGDIYTGDFKNDMANGYGEYIHTNGSKYVGEFKDDVQEGHSKYIHHIPIFYFLSNFLYISSH